MKNILQFWRSHDSRLWFVVLLSLGGFVLCEVVYRMILDVGPKAPQIFSFPSNANVAAISGLHYASSSAGLLIDINGGVRQPGIYHLPPVSRVRDAISRAGGFSQDVDARFVLQRLNLVEKLHDAEKIYIPRRGESIHLPFLYGYGNDVNGTGIVQSKAKKKTSARKKRTSQTAISATL